MSMGQFMPMMAGGGGGVSGEWSVVDYAEGTSSTVTLPNWEEGDLVFVLTRSGAASTPPVPSWNGSVLLGTDTSGLNRGSWLFKIMASGDTSSISVPGVGSYWEAVTLRWSGNPLNYIAHDGVQLVGSPNITASPTISGVGHQLVIVSGTAGASSFTRVPNDYEIEVFNKVGRYFSSNSNYDDTLTISSTGTEVVNKGIHWIQFA